MMPTLASGFKIEQLFWGRPLPLPWMVLVFAVVIFWSLYLYRRSLGLRPSLRYTLGIVRLFALILIVAAFFEPANVKSR